VCFLIDRGIGLEEELAKEIRMEVVAGAEHVNPGCFGFRIGVQPATRSLLFSS
jgi:hypothetical protein